MRSVWTISLILLASLACTVGDPNHNPGLGGAEEDSGPNVVITTGTPPTGPYQSVCTNCSYAESFQLGSDNTQTGIMKTLFCQCPRPQEGESDFLQPTLMLVVPSDSTVDINYCTGPGAGGWGVLVPCDCSDTTCIENNTLAPASLSSDNAYIDSCAGCSVVQSDNGNAVLACAGCLKNDGVTYSLAVATLRASVTEMSINNCDGQLEARENHLDCRNDKSDLKKYLEKVWDKVKGAFSDVFAYILANPPASSDGEEDFYIGAADEAADAGSDGTESIVDTLLSIIGSMLGIV